MSSRHFTAARALLAAPLLSVLASPPASAARIQLGAEGHDSYFCSAVTKTRDGQQIHTPLVSVNAQRSAFLELGELPADRDGDSPNFDRLTLSCWIRTRPQGTYRQYEIDLYRWESFWLAPDAATGSPKPSLPRDGTMIGFKLATAGDAEQPRHIDIVSAWTQPDYDPASAHLEYDHLDAYHRLSPERGARRRR